MATKKIEGEGVSKTIGGIHFVLKLNFFELLKLCNALLLKYIGKTRL